MLPRLALLLALLPPALAAEEWVALEPIEPASDRWGPMIPSAGPERDGQPIVALRWEPKRSSAPNSPALLQGWETVATLRFWMHTDRSYPFSMTMVLTGSGGNGYFSTAFPLDFTGWQQIVIPMANFKQVRTADLATSTTLGFRAQGYGQPALDDGMVLWVDDIEALPKPGMKLKVTNSQEINWSRWMALAEQGNPLQILAAAKYDQPLAAYQPPQELTSAWQYRGEAQNLLSVAWAAADPASPHRARVDLVDHAIQMTDWLVEQCDSEGWWWHPGSPTGDPNVNRFTLGPLLDAIYRLRSLPAGKQAWPRWADKLDAAIALQRRSYEQQDVAWDWGGKASGDYVNQDVYYLLIMELSSRLYDRVADHDLAAKMMKKVAGNLLPDGGWHYIGQEQESPIYHALDLVILARYATLADDPTVWDNLRASAPYYPLVCTAEAYPESWSDVWWKQNWGDAWTEGMIIAAGASKDAVNQWLMWQRLARVAPSDNGMGTIYAMPFWPGPDPGLALPDTFVLPDHNIRGLRGRAGQWYYGVTQGRGLRNTFVGGLITSPTGTNPLRAAFRGANIGVQQDPSFNQRLRGGLFLSQAHDTTGLAMRPNGPIAVGARYRLQPGTINGSPTPETPDTPWQVDQLWLACAQGIVGRVKLTALEDAAGQAVVGRIRLGPAVLTGEGDLWHSGPLTVKLLDSFGEVKPAPMPHYTQPIDRTWPGLELRQALPEGGAKAGQTFTYAVYLGPDDQPVPESIDVLDDELGFRVQWPDGPRLAVCFNPEGKPQTASLNWNDFQPGVWTGEEGAEPETEAARGTLDVILQPGQCVVAEWDAE